MLLSPAYVPRRPSCSRLSFLLCRSTSASLPSQSFWNKFKNKKTDNNEYQRQSQMALARQRLLTLAYGDMETIRVVSRSSPCPIRRSSIQSAATKLSCVCASLSMPYPSRPPSLGTRSCRQRLDKAPTRCHLQLASADRICLSPCLREHDSLAQIVLLKSPLAAGLGTVYLCASSPLLMHYLTLISRSNASS